MNIEILYQDESILIVNKPSGLLTIRDGYNPDLPTVKTLLESDFGRCWIVHRLDKETSGILLVARNENSHRELNNAFSNRLVKKIYHAIVSGIPDKNVFTVDLPLYVDGDRKHRTVVNLDFGKPAKSVIKMMDRYKEFSLLSIEPETGYTHQIRAHLSNSGFPIIGDKLYQTRLQYDYSKKFINRTALHAYQIAFVHPDTQSLITIQAKYPPDFETAIAMIK